MYADVVGLYDPTGKCGVGNCQAVGRLFHFRPDGSLCNWPTFESAKMMSRMARDCFGIT